MEIDITVSGLRVLQPEVFADDRGHFFESYNERRFETEIGRTVVFVQDNHSFSVKGVLRGLHYQLPPHPQAKLVRCVSGAVWDVAVDIRRTSPTFGKWFGLELSAENKKELWLPEGMAHGFLALSEGAELLYKTTEYYAPECDRSIRWDDPDIGIEWSIHGSPLLSPKDELAPRLAEAEVFE